MKISERIKSLFRRQPLTAEELAARAEAEGIRDQPREDPVVLEHQIVERLESGTFTPPFLISSSPFLPAGLVRPGSVRSAGPVFRSDRQS
jgi:hypothetical protein